MRRFIIKASKKGKRVMEKSIEEKIFETREIIKQVIAEENLSPAIVEMILHELYLEVKALSNSVVQQKINERKVQESTEEEPPKED